MLRRRPISAARGRAARTAPGRRTLARLRARRVGTQTARVLFEAPVANGLLGSVDANRGDPQNGWDTDQFPTDIYLTTQCMRFFSRRSQRC